jgi:hypothetical protein
MFLERYRYSKVLICPNEEGNEPVIRFDDKESKIKFVKPPKTFGMVPVS